MMARKQNPTTAGNQTWNTVPWQEKRIYRLDHVGIRGNESADLLAGNATLDSTEMIIDSICNQGSHGYIAE